MWNWVGWMALAVGAGDDWPQWRGADGTGVSRETQWSSAGRPLWRAAVGLGHSSVSVRDGRCYTLGHDADARTDTLFCLDAETGAARWTASWPAATRAFDHTGGTLTTPTVTADGVFVSTREGGLVRFDAETGERRWSVDLVAVLGVDPGRYGFSASPVVLGGRVIACADRVAALDAATGELVWQTEPLSAQYSTPAPFELGDQRLLAVFTQADLSVLELATGAERWAHPWAPTPRGVNASTPVVVGERLFISSAYERGCALLAFDGERIVPTWESRRMRNKMAGCVLVEGLVFGFDESMLKCLDLEGQERWRKRGLGNGAVAAAGDRLILTSSKGELIVAEANVAEYRELSRVKLFEEGTFWTPPTIAGGRIYVRSGLGELVARDHRGAAQAAAAAAAVDAEAAARPAAGELFARHLERIGGAEALRAHASMRLSGTFEMRSVGFPPVPMEIVLAAPDRVRRQVKLPGGREGHSVRVFDGELGFELNPYLGDTLADADLQREYEDTAGLHAAADWREHYRAMETTGLVDFADRPCWRVDAVTASGTPRAVYFSVATGFLVGREAPTESAVVFDDYRPVDDLLVPMLRRVFLHGTGIEEIWRVERVELDVPVAPELFARSDEIRALLEQQTSERPGD